MHFEQHTLLEKLQRFEETSKPLLDNYVKYQTMSLAAKYYDDNSLNAIMKELLGTSHSRKHD